MTTLKELSRRQDMHRAAVWGQVVGLALTCLAIGALAGVWWAVLVFGGMLFAGCVLREAGWL